jgi:NADH:ubiquinone oxidoreductase subunit K
MLDGELEAHYFLNVNGVVVVVIVQLEQLSRAMMQLFNLLVMVANADQVVVVGGVKFVFRAEQHFANDHIDDLSRHD